jgi:hypothetical protein
MPYQSYPIIKLSDNSNYPILPGARYLESFDNLIIENNLKTNYLSETVFPFY